MGLPEGESGLAAPGGGGMALPDGLTGALASGVGDTSAGSTEADSGGGVPSAPGRALEMTRRLGSGAGGGGGVGSGSGLWAATFGMGLPSAASTTRSASDGPWSTGAGAGAGAGAGSGAAAAGRRVGDGGAGGGGFDGRLPGFARSGESAVSGVPFSSSVVAAGRVEDTVAAGASDSSVDGPVSCGSVEASSVVAAAGFGAAFLAAAFFFGAALLVAAFFFAAAFFFVAFLTGLGSSGCSSRVRPSRSARRRSMSAYASWSDEEGPFAATPAVPARSSTSALVIPSSLASSWILIFFAATFRFNLPCRSFPHVASRIAATSSCVTAERQARANWFLAIAASRHASSAPPSGVRHSHAPRPLLAPSTTTVDRPSGARAIVSRTTASQGRRVRQPMQLRSGT